MLALSASIAIDSNRPTINDQRSTIKDLKDLPFRLPENKSYAGVAGTAGWRIPPASLCCRRAFQ
jgi:hypothetical protein